MKYYKTLILFTVLMAGLLTACYETQETAADENVQVLEVSAWPEGNVYYHIDGSFDRNDENDLYTLRMIRLAMNEWSAAGKVNFIERTGPGEYVCVISKSDRNASTVGYRKDPRISLISMASQRQATHEIGHLLGFTHEHQRPDRDDYITVHWNSIRPDAAACSHTRCASR